MVEKAKHHIHEGDIFQIVLSNRLEADFEGSLFGTYEVMRELNPSPYMFYFSGTDVEVAGASPETLVKLEDGVLHTFPLAGTRPRGKTEEEDILLEKELLSDEKELAEHNMLVDLGRNDIGKISEFGSVEVEKYHCIQRFSHVMHIGSTVRGEIRKDKDALDAYAVDVQDLPVPQQHPGVLCADDGELVFAEHHLSAHLAGEVAVLDIAEVERRLGKEPVGVGLHGTHVVVP